MNSEIGHRNRPVSWVRRGVRMTEGQEAAWNQHGEKYLIEPPRSVARESIAPDWVLDPAAIFDSPSSCAQSSLPCAQSLSGERSTQCGDLPVGEASQGLDSTVPMPACPKRFIVEIGTGRGENIVAAAAREPDSNFLGVEVYGPGLARAILLAESAGTGVPLLHVTPEIAQAVANALVPDGQGLRNLRLIQADAPELLASLPADSVDELWVFFPDPWPKNRHLKRRLVDENFTPLAARVLKHGGIIRMATDWQHYADQMQEVFAKASGIFEPVATNPLPPVEEGLGPVAKNGDERFAGRVLTAFETKGIREGREITDLAYRRAVS